MKSLSAKTFQCGVTVQGLTTLSGTVYLTALTNTATWDYVVVGTTAQGQLYTRTYAQLMSDITSGIGLSGYVPTSRTLTINGVSYDLTANRSWTISTVDYTSRLQHQVKAGVAINKGQAVYVTSADGTNMIVGLASNASEATSSKTMGLLDATVSTNGFANVVTEGLLAGLDTSTAGTEGDPVWLGTGGNLIYGLINKPYAPAHLVFIGIVTRKNSNNGEIFVKVQNGFELNEIHDVDLKTNLPVNGELLGFNGTLWVNKTIAGWLGYTPANASGTTNYISKFTGSTTLGNSLIYDDGSNVGIGTTSPGARFTVQTTTSSSAHTLRVTDGTGIINIGHWDTVTNRFEFSGKPTYFVQYGTGNYISFGTLGSENMRIVAGGNVGIGTSSPSRALNIVSNNAQIRISDNTAPTTNYWEFSSVFFNTNQDLFISNQSGTAITLNASLNVGIGTTSPSYKLDVNGIGNFSNGFSNPSSETGYRLKFYDNGGIYNDAGIGLDGSGGGGEIMWFNALGGFYWGLGTSGTKMKLDSSGNLGIGIISPTTPLHVSGIIQVEGGGSTTFYGTDASGSYARNFGTQLYTFRDAGGSIITSINTTSGVITTTGGNSTNWNTAYGWGNHSSAGYVPQARTLTINGTSYDLSANRSWTIATTTPGGSDTQFQYNSSGSLAGASALTYNSTNNRIGVNQASPGYDLDVNGQVRVQDKLRVGNVNSGNGVVHMSSTATINPSATTIVWAQNVSVGMCAFIEYYILNNNSLTDQRAGTIMVTWNQSGTPTIAHTETTTPDIGSTIAVNFTSSLVGSDARINAVNSSANPYTMVMSYKYF
jgi:YD repeat-containing protein